MLFSHPCPEQIKTPDNKSWKRNLNETLLRRGTCELASPGSVDDAWCGVLLPPTLLSPSSNLKLQMARCHHHPAKGIVVGGSGTGNPGSSRGLPLHSRRRASRETDTRARATLPHAGRYAPRGDAHTEHTFSPFTFSLTAASAFRATQIKCHQDMLEQSQSKPLPVVMYCHHTNTIYKNYIPMNIFLK